GYRGPGSVNEEQIARYVVDNLSRPPIESRHRADCIHSDATIRTNVRAARTSANEIRAFRSSWCSIRGAQVVQVATASSSGVRPGVAGTVQVEHATKYYKTNTGSVHALEDINL